METVLKTSDCVGDWVTQYPATACVFDQQMMDYCCGGDATDTGRVLWSRQNRRLAGLSASEGKEHGAYVILGVPLITALVIGGVTPVASLVAIAAVAAFLAHESLIIATVRRGNRVRESAFSARARIWRVPISLVSADIVLPNVRLHPRHLKRNQWSVLVVNVASGLFAIGFCNH